MTDLPGRDAVLRVLDQIKDPKSGQGLVEAGLVQGLVVQDGRAGFVIEVPAADAPVYGPVRGQAEAALLAMPGMVKASVVLTAAAAPNGRRARLAPDPQAQPSPATAQRPDHVRRVIAVASGKGGVGKSTVAVNLACALAAMGLRVGLLDADVYGPSAPTMLGINEEPVYRDGKLEPLTAHGVKAMSIGFMVGDKAPMVWRGPMASSAVRQLAQDVRWGTEGEPLDVLVLDLPPGTGDIQLTLVQKVKIDGAVLVTTPQEIALADARRGAEMFAKTGTPILGVVENMAFFADPATGAPIAIFGQGGGAAEAQRLGVPLLAQIPIEVAVREGGDAGLPVVLAGDSAAAEALRQAAASLLT